MNLIVATTAFPRSFVRSEASEAPSQSGVSRKSRSHACILSSASWHEMLPKALISGIVQFAVEPWGCRPRVGAVSAVAARIRGVWPNPDVIVAELVKDGDTVGRPVVERFDEGRRIPKARRGEGTSLVPEICGLCGRSSLVVYPAVDRCRSEPLHADTVHKTRLQSFAGIVA
ncbi:hypothetical protein CNMCM5623_003532 [Aspergillus felis]|uniref:Uncharacterized protein n=1 Tax=Aspergillus felis TaxID=1287682 RepID=A0A8H6V225_9EURO|nr:hypothetical protein CNMCM5623_003532 [Aspergillus felis]